MPSQGRRPRESAARTRTNKCRSSGTGLRPVRPGSAGRREPGSLPGAGLVFCTAAPSSPGSLDGRFTRPAAVAPALRLGFEVSASYRRIRRGTIGGCSARTRLSSPFLRPVGESGSGASSVDRLRTEEEPRGTATFARTPQRSSPSHPRSRRRLPGRETARPRGSGPSDAGNKGGFTLRFARPHRPWIMSSNN